MSDVRGVGSQATSRVTADEGRTAPPAERLPAAAGSRKGNVEPTCLLGRGTVTMPTKSAWT